MSVKSFDLPDYISKNKSLWALNKNRKGVKYKDNLSLFRCLAVHRGQKTNLESSAKLYYHQWCSYLEDKKGEKDFPSPNQFPGFDYCDDLHEIERCFRLNINLFSLQEDGSAFPYHRSLSRHKDTMNLNLFEHHVSYITNMKAYAKKYVCKMCEKMFPSSYQCTRHEKTCENKTVSKFPGGFHQVRQTIFDQLESFGCVVPPEDRVFPWFIVFDFEAILKPKNNDKSAKLQWHSEHVPVSVSVCSNVRKHTSPECFVHEEPDKLIKDMVTYMEEISDTCYTLASKKWAYVRDSLDQQFERWQNKENPKNTDKAMVKAIDQMRDKFHFYCRQVPVLGFNSAKYDLNLIKNNIARHLRLHETNGITIKKNNTYTCISNNKLRLLDITNFLAPGTSYASFLRAYQIEEQKGFFPYEHLKRFRQLEEEKKLPPHEAFYSSLRNTNISPEDYKFCQDVWEKENMNCLKDFLVWYNNQDVGPFVEAVEKLQRIYFESGIDVFKVAMSVPGIARTMLFQTSSRAHASFALYGEQDKDLFKTVKNNIVGGPSIIFSRYAKSGETTIRNNPEKPCESIVGYDANALYLWAIDQNMPTGPFIRRRAENGFRGEVRDRYMSAFYWLDYMSSVSGHFIQHRLNTGKEKRVGPYPVDGYCADTNTIFQFHGCYFHGHKCHLTKNIKDKKWHEKRESLFNKTKETSEFLRQEKFSVNEIWECEYNVLKQQSACLQKIITDKTPQFYKKYKGCVTENQILQGVLDETLFGMVEVNIKIPDQWPDHMQKSLSPYEYFQEMAPIFCTTDIPFDAIGSHMQNHARENNLSENPRRLLVGGLRARKILLATPLLKWYLNHGMDVTHIYQVIEYTPSRCFREFVREVTNDRRLGDRDPSMAILADTSKLRGNSSYGSLIMDQSKHREIKYVKGIEEATMEVNDSKFINLTDLGHHVFEIEKAKSRISYDLPVQLGYFILQYAKLRMLQFYYDFVDKFVERSDFSYCEMDTDSAYMAISGRNLESIVKPELLGEFRHGLMNYCTDTEIEADDLVHWFPRECCQKHKKHDKRTPGLFKLEYTGDEMIGLCSKTYIVSQTSVRDPRIQQKAYQLLRKACNRKTKRLNSFRPRTYHNVKFSCKGITKRYVSAPLHTFRKVLKSRKSAIGFNKGFRARNNTIFTYEQERCGFSYFYCKRKVLNNGIDTEVLDIELCPEKRDLDDEQNITTLLELMEQ